MTAGGVSLRLYVLVAWIFISLPSLTAHASGAGGTFSETADEAKLDTVSKLPPAIFITDLARYSDDGVALLMLLRSRAFDVKGIITSAGNVCAGDAAEYTRGLLQSVGAKPVTVIEGPQLSWYEERRRFYLEGERPSWERKGAYAGALSPEVSCTSEGARSDLGGAASTRAADLLIDVAKQHGGRLVIILASPATVLAQALRKEPGLAALFSRIYAMGGSIDVPGNVTPNAEFNVWFDPEAMAEVFRSGVPVTLVPLDATNPVTYDPPSMGDLQAGGPGAQYLARYLEFRHADIRKVPMWDEVNAAVAIDPSVVLNEEQHFLTVATSRDSQYGKVSILPAAEGASQLPVKVVTRVDASRVREILSRLVIEKP